MAERGFLLILGDLPFSDPPVQHLCHGFDGFLHRFPGYVIQANGEAVGGALEPDLVAHVPRPDDADRIDGIHVN